MRSLGMYSLVVLCNAVKCLDRGASYEAHKKLLTNVSGKSRIARRGGQLGRVVE